MSEFECRKCHADLESYNMSEYREVRFCPNCGAKVLKSQREGLRRKAGDEELDDMIKGRLLDALELCGKDGIHAESLAYKAWETENNNGTVYCSNYKAFLFAARHLRWVDDALDYARDEYGDADKWITMRASCIDRFLVIAFILATEHFLYVQLGIDCDEGKLSKKRIREIRRLIKSSRYDGSF